MGNLRSVGGWGEVDLDQRAITTEDDIVDLSELDRSDDQPNQPAPATQNGAAEHDEPGEGQPPAAASRPHRIPAKPHPQAMRPARRAMRTSTAGSRTALPDWRSAVAASKPSTPPLASDARDPASGDAPTAASGAAGVPLRRSHGAGGHQLPQPATPHRPAIATARPARTSSRGDRCAHAHSWRDGHRDQRSHDQHPTRAASRSQPQTQLR